eukprot:6319086-Amphidinium_carterae.1
MDAGEVFLATPALEGLKALASLRMTYDVFHVLDISRAHQHCDLTREVFIRLPKEDPRSEEDDTCGLLQKALNGVCDAAQVIEQKIKRLCIEVGAQQVAFNPCTCSTIVQSGKQYKSSGLDDEAVGSRVRVAIGRHFP